jgi:gluconolactonase
MFTFTEGRMKHFIPTFLICFMTIAYSVSTAQAQVIERLDPALNELIAPDAKLELVADLGKSGSVEGPVWMHDAKSPDGGYFLFSNRGPRDISKWSKNTPLAPAYDLIKLLPGMEEETSSSSGIALDPEGRLVICSAAVHAVVRIEKNGTTTQLAHLVNGYPLNRPNDLTIKSNGTIYFTDNSRDTTGRAPPAVYMIKDGKMTTIINDLVRPNGTTLSPDEKVLYVNDSEGRRVFRYDVLPDDTVANGGLFIDMGVIKDPGTADGMKTDVKGNLYNTGPGGVWIISPEGKHLGRIRTPERLTNLAFGGPDGKTLFLTGHEMLFYIQVKVPGI